MPVKHVNTPQLMPMLEYSVGKILRGEEYENVLDYVLQLAKKYKKQTELIRESNDMRKVCGIMGKYWSVFCKYILENYKNIKVLKPNRTLLNKLIKAANILNQEHDQRIYKLSVQAAITNRFFSCNYRRPQSRWVGGDCDVLVEFVDTYNEIDIDSDVTIEWHKKHTWSGRSVTHTIKIQKNWMETVYNTDYCVVDNMLTLAIRDVGPTNNLLTANGVIKVVNAVWVVQKRGLTLGTEDGYIIQDQYGLFHASSNAKKWQIEKQIIARREARIVEEVEKLNKEKRLNELKEVIVTINDALNAGLCKTGINDWIHRYLPEETKEIPALELLRLADTVNDRKHLVERAINMALVRHRKEQLHQVSAV